MAERRKRSRAYPRITEVEFDRLMDLITPMMFETVSAHAYRRAAILLSRFLGPDWVQRHVTNSGSGFLNWDGNDGLRETRMTRTVMLAEMIFNFQHVSGFNSLMAELSGGDVESAYAVFDIVRLIQTSALDRGLTFRFVPKSKIKRRSYDLSLRFSDGVAARAEAKCKLEETEISVGTIRESLKEAIKQLPPHAPGMAFIKVPRWWLHEGEFPDEIPRLVKRTFGTSKRLVSIKFYTSQVGQRKDQHGDIIFEIMSCREFNNPKHRFRKLASRNWHIFPSIPTAAPPPVGVDYNGLPRTWKRIPEPLRKR